MADLNRIKQLAGLAINELDDTDSGDWSFTTTDGHKVVDQIDPADGAYDEYHVSTPVGDIYAYYDPSYDEEGGDYVEWDAENPEVKRMLPQSVKQDEVNGIINDIVDTVAGGKYESVTENSDMTKTFKTPYGKVDANWDSNAGEFGDFDAEDKQLRDIMMNMADDFGSVDHDNVRDFVKAAMKKRKSMS